LCDNGFESPILPEKVNFVQSGSSGMKVGHPCIGLANWIEHFSGPVGLHLTVRSFPGPIRAIGAP
jgi:hypothetical protein